MKIVIVCQSGRLSAEAVVLAHSLILLGAKHQLIVAYPRKTERWSWDPVPDTDLVAYLGELGATCIEIDNEMFGSRYPVANKVYALGVLGDDEDFMFYDTDMLFLRDFDLDADFGTYMAAPGDSWPFGPFETFSRDQIWRSLYELADLDLEDYVNPNFPKDAKERYPYYNGGCIRGRKASLLSRTILDLMEKVDRAPPDELAHQPIFPWLDQIVLPIAYAKAGGGSERLPERLNSLRVNDETVAWHYHYIFRIFDEENAFARRRVSQISEIKDVRRFLMRDATFHWYLFGPGEAQYRKAIETIGPKRSFFERSGPLRDYGFLVR